MKPILITITLALCASALAGCSSTSGAPRAASMPSAPAVATEHGYTLVFIRTGPQSGQLSKEENARAFAGHFENMERLANERKLLVAGPYARERHDADLRGLFILDTAQRAQAEAWAGTDPTTLAGVFTLDYHALVTDAPLLRALEADLAWRAAQVARGHAPQPGEGARPWVLLTAENGDLARRELLPLVTPEGGVCLFARLDDTRAFALLDAQNLAEARERWAPQLEHLGPYTLDEWFASSQLAHLPEWGGG